MTYGLVKSYLGQVRRSYGRYQRRVGTTVTWYQFDPTESAPVDFYDESPEASWRNGIELPVLSVIRDEDKERMREEGLYTGGSLHLSFSAEQARRAGMVAVLDARLHLRDRFYWDGEYWSVNTYQISGRLIRHEVIIGVDATRIATEELVNQESFPPTPGR
jgi:hypothetical protein